MKLNAERMRELLQMHRLSQAHIAYAIGVNRRVVSRWTAGTREPSEKNIEKLAGLFMVAPETLVIKEYV